MRGDAGLGHAVHVVGTDLHLDRHAIGAEQRGVQRLVAVDARDGDVVLEAPRHRLVDAVHDAERAIAGVDRIDSDANSVDVDDLGQHRPLAQHLAVDAEQMLFARFHPPGNRRLLQRRLELRPDLVEEFLLVAAGALECALDHAVALRIKSLKAQILELELHRVQAEPLGHRRIDVERLARDGAALGGRQRIDGAQVVHAIGELDQDHAQVAHHRQQHLAEVLRLRFLAILETDLIEFGHAIDDLGDIVAEAGSDIGLGDRGVFDDVVQNRPDDGVGVEMQVGEDLGRGHRVRDVRLARHALLALVRGGAELGGFPDALHLLVRQVGGNFSQQLLDTRRAAFRAGQ